MADKTNALLKPMQPSKELAAIVGAEPLSRAEVVKKVWEHIRESGLQNAANRREILADAKLKAVVGADRISMFELSRHLSRHVAPQAVAAADCRTAIPGSADVSAPETPPAAALPQSQAASLNAIFRGFFGAFAPVWPMRWGA